MATSGPGPVRELDYGAVEVYSEKSLGVGSYGKVCKAKCGQLPCAAKLLHDTMFGNNDPGIDKYVQQFEQECRFLRMIKHPNIVQFLGTVTDPQSRRLALLMELMDESLTRFLERSTGPLPYHTQLNICHDVALALAYLHPNDIIHRDLSSNNVLLVGDGSRTKVTDFGMSKLIGINSRMTPLTLCPGTAAYMPPEALVTPPRYSNKLDCFSHGVLTIQIVTRQFPNPTDPTTTVEDARFPTGIVHVPVPERERRKKDIDLVDPNHPLLPLALHCLKDRDTERPSADELCGRLATLKGEQMYTRSVEQSREQSVSVQTLQQQIQEKDGELAAARANHEIELQECSHKIEQKSDELEKARANHEIELQEYSHKIEQKSDELERARANHETELQEYSRKIQKQSDELERAKANHETELRECHATFQQQIQEKESMLEKARADSQTALQAQINNEKSKDIAAEAKPQVCIPPSPVSSRLHGVNAKEALLYSIMWAKSSYEWWAALN